MHVIVNKPQPSHSRVAELTIDHQSKAATPDATCKEAREIGN